MEKYFNQTQGLLGLIQATISEKEMENSAKAGEEMWEAIREITNKYQLNINEMLNATLACHSTIIEVAMEQMDEVKEEMKSNE
jgi:hypothetical protein